MDSICSLLLIVVRIVLRLLFGFGSWLLNFSNTLVKNACMPVPKMIGFEIFIIVAFMCSENRMLCFLAFWIWCVRNVSSVWRCIMAVFMILSVRILRLFLRIVIVLLVVMCLICSVLLVVIVIDCLVEWKLLLFIVVTCDFELRDYVFIECGCLCANAFMEVGACWFELFLCRMGLIVLFFMWL